RFFREQFRRHWIVAIAPPEGGTAITLLAVDSNQCIVGATRGARTILFLDDAKLRAGLSLWNIFAPDRSLFRRNDTTDIAARLVITGTDEAWPAFLTQPERNLSTC